MDECDVDETVFLALGATAGESLGWGVEVSSSSLSSSQEIVSAGLRAASGLRGLSVLWLGELREKRY